MTSKKRYSNRISKFEDLKGFDGIQFIVLYEDCVRYDDGYGGRASTSYLAIEGFENEEQLKEWIHNEMKPKQYGSSPRDYKILRWQQIEPLIQISINL